MLVSGAFVFVFIYIFFKFIAQPTDDDENKQTNLTGMKTLSKNKSMYQILI